MVPPPALRRRMQAEAAAAAKARTPNREAQQGRWGLQGRAALTAFGLALACLCCSVHYWLFWVRGAGLVDEPPGPAAALLLGKADAAIRKAYNYTLALEHLRLALELEPRNAGVVQFYASVLLALGHVADARRHLRDVFRSGVAAARDPHLLQQYVLTLHRLGARAELDEAWPSIAQTPGLGWRSPLQCPDRVDASLLEGAEPFPALEGLRVPEILARNSEAILADFAALRETKVGLRGFKPNQDNDLVSGNNASRWTEMLLFNKGSWDERNCQAFPTVCRVLRGLPEVEGIVHGKRSGQVSLLKLEAGTVLVPHFGSVNWRYTGHLGLMVPPDVVMHAGNESREFKLGEVLVLDDSFLHSVEHKGQGPRITLFVNFFHPKMKALSHEEWLRRESVA